MNLHCWSCKEELELDSDYEPEDNDKIECASCGEINVVNGTRTMSEDQAYESRCESEEARRYEDTAHGAADSDFDDGHDSQPRFRG